MSEALGKEVCDFDSGKRRYFNTLSLDTRRGIVTKKSTDTKKFLDEIKWYLNVPDNLSFVRPRIFDYSFHPERAFVSMEYYGYPTVSDQYVGNRLKASQWRKVFDALFYVVEEMKNNPMHASFEIKRNSIQDMYVHKTVDRLESLKPDSRFSPLFSKEIVVNGQVYPSLQNIIDELPMRVEQMGLYDVDDFYFFHGDLCFSNILYEKSGIVRLIDPRGSFGGVKLYGDIRYDLAKILHSIHGQYDLIIHDFFKVSLNDESTIEKHVLYCDYEAICIKMFEEHVEKLGYSVSQIYFIESLLFLSMVPLHKDSLERQIAMLANGVQFFSKATEGLR